MSDTIEKLVVVVICEDGHRWETALFHKLPDALIWFCERVQMLAHLETPLSFHEAQNVMQDLRGSDGYYAYTIDEDVSVK